jgi:predicted lysophospholipase L1 biosynthesis ABC-type transport system permease subunit
MKELGLFPSFEDALQPVPLYAAYGPAKLERAALRWFARYLDEGKAVSLLRARLALSVLADLRVASRSTPGSCSPSLNVHSLLTLLLVRGGLVRVPRSASR